MKQTDKTKLGYGIAIIAILLVLNQIGYLGPKIPLQYQPTAPPTGEITFISGILTSANQAYDSLDPSTTRTSSNVATYWYAYRSAGWVLLGTGTGTDLNILKDDQNTLYAVLSIPTNQHFYVDYAKIQSMNTRVQSVDYKDITGSGVQQYVFRLNVGDSPYASGTGKYNMPLFTEYLLTADDEGDHTLVSPSAITGIGTAQQTKFLAYYSTMSLAKYGLAVSKVTLTINSSDTSKVTLKKLNVPGIGNLDGSSFDQNVQTTQVLYTYKVSNILYGADYLQLPTNILNKFDFTTQLQFNLADNDVLQITLTIYYLDYAQTVHAITGTVLCSA